MTNTTIQKTDLERLEELHRELDLTYRPKCYRWEIKGSVPAEQFVHIADDVFQYYSEMLGQYLKCMEETHECSIPVRADELQYEGLDGSVKWHPTINLRQVITSIGQSDFEDQYREWQEDNGAGEDCYGDFRDYQVVIGEIANAMLTLNDEIGITVGFRPLIHNCIKEYTDELSGLVLINDEVKYRFGPTYYAAKFIHLFFNTFGSYSLVTDPDW